MGHFFAAVFGAITPFCSCSSIPLFVSFVKARIRLGITMSFLATSPLINQYIVIIMLASFGLKITFAYVISGLLIGVFSGILVDKLKLELDAVSTICGPISSLRNRVEEVQGGRETFEETGGNISV